MLAVEADRLGDELAYRPLGGRQRGWTRLGHRRGGYRRAVGWDVVQEAELEWEERPAHEGQEPRHAATLTEPAGMTESRARMWRYPAHTRGRRHLDPDQEEVLVPLRGTLTMLLGEPLGAGGRRAGRSGGRASGHAAPDAQREQRGDPRLRLRRPDPATATRSSLEGVESL